MTRRLRWVGVALAALTTVGLAWGPADAADKTKVDQATNRVQQGARQIGQGDVGQGVKETAKGIGYTIVEGAKFSGQTIKEFFEKTFN